jgi:hypothetical protein
MLPLLPQPDSNKVAWKQKFRRKKKFWMKTHEEKKKRENTFFGRNEKVRR